jgi:hypothetical protein
MHRHALKRTFSHGRDRIPAGLTLCVLCTLCALCLFRAEQLPTRLSDTAFWQLVTDLSEPGGSFISDNLVSNESTFQRVVPDLRRAAGPGGVYLGVGPDQNFTYIAALQPRMAFIVDVRRQNMLLHLMYKAMIELSATRAEFLSRLLSRPPPPVSAPAIAELVAWYQRAVPDQAMFDRNVHEVIEHLVERHRFPLSTADIAAVGRIQRAFFEAGPELRYSYPHRWFPSFADLVLETDDRGEHHGYLSSDEAFQRLKQIEASNLVVPVVGDFAGTRALRAVGRYLKAHGARVNVFYTSNVEFYLFEHGGWNGFLANVATLPLDRNSVFIRAHFDNGSRQGSRSSTELDPIGDVMSAYSAGRIRSYGDVMRRSAGLSGH